MEKKQLVKKPLVTISILSWNAKSDLRYTLRELQKQTYSDIEVIVVDSASTDGSPQMVEEKFPEVKLIRMPRNLGIEGWNWGFVNARGKYIIALDQDSHPAKEAVEQMVTELEKDAKLGIIACNIVNYKNKHSEFKYLPAGNSQKSFDWYDFIGCGAVIRKSVLEKVGYFSERLFLYGHEIDLALRVIDAGYKVRLYPNIIVYHRKAPTHHTSGRGIFYSTRNFPLMAWRRFPLGDALSTTFAVFIENGILSLRGRNLSAYLKGVLFWFLGLIWIPERRKTVSEKTMAKVRKHFPFTMKNLVKRFLGTYNITE